MSKWYQRPVLILPAIAVLAISALAANYYYRLHLQEGDDVSSPDAASLIGQRRPDFTLPDVLGLPHRIGEWDGRRVLIVNFWATWCKPCLREIPAFAELQKEYGAHGVQFVGIALDGISEVDTFIKDMKTAPGYPMLIGGSDGIAVAREFGDEVGILPYTVIVDKDGRIAYVQFGELTRDAAEQMILSLL